MTKNFYWTKIQQSTHIVLHSQAHRSQETE
jgi:hypothetical protein